MPLWARPAGDRPCRSFETASSESERLPPLEKVDRLKTHVTQRQDKRSRRRDELAGAAIEALKQLGYARTSLRDIAAQSGVSVGVLHYYFEDKVELICFCVQKYKADFVAAMDDILFATEDMAAAPEAFARGLGLSIRNDATTHRLWYDIRAQALFEDSFQQVVADIKQDLIDLVKRLLSRMALPEQDAIPLYTGLDGAFRYYLQRHLRGDAAAVAEFEAYVRSQLQQVAAGAPPARLQ